MTETIKLHKLVVKADYQPTLMVYPHMDAVVMSRVSDFPQWERGPLAVAMRNPQLRRSFAITFNTCQSTCDFPPDARAELDLSLETLQNALNKFQVNKLEKLSVAQVFGIPEAERTFEDLVLRLEKKFHVGFDTIPAFDDLALSDTAYIVNAKDKDNSRWARTIQVGPMTRSEWFTRFPIDQQLLSGDPQFLDFYKQSVPELFSFVSIDASCVRPVRQQAIRNAPDIARRSLAIAEGLATYIGD